MRCKGVVRQSASTINVGPAQPQLHEITRALPVSVFQQRSSGYELLLRGQQLLAAAELLHVSLAQQSHKVPIIHRMPYAHVHSAHKRGLGGDTALQT